MTPPRPAVLLVDDDPFVRDVLSRILERRFQVRSTASAEEALEIIVDQPEFDAILSDVMMPGIGGEGLLSRLPAHLQERLVFMTGGFVHDDVRDFLDRAARPILFKPVSVTDLFDTIGHIVKLPAGSPAQAPANTPLSAVG